MGITPIEGYIIRCDKCGEEEVYWENPEYFSAIEIDKGLMDFLSDLEEKGWYIEQGEDGRITRILCPKCAEEG